MIKIEVIALDKNLKRDLKLSGSAKEITLKVPAIPKKGDFFNLIEADFGLEVHEVCFDQRSKQTCGVVVFLVPRGAKP